MMQRMLYSSTNSSIFECFFSGYRSQITRLEWERSRATEIASWSVTPFLIQLEIISFTSVEWLILIRKPVDKIF